MLLDENERRGLALVSRTQDVFLARYYGQEHWTDIIRWLIEQNWDDQEIEAILRSHYMNWAAAQSGEMSFRSFQSFYEAAEPHWHYFSHKEIDKLVDQTFPPADAMEQDARLQRRQNRCKPDHSLLLRRVQPRITWAKAS